MRIRGPRKADRQTDGQTGSIATRGSWHVFPRPTLKTIIHLGVCSLSSLYLVCALLAMDLKFADLLYIQTLGA
jgi:hypothetical protein